MKKRTKEQNTGHSEIEKLPICVLQKKMWYCHARISTDFCANSFMRKLVQLWCPSVNSAANACSWIWLQQCNRTESAVAFASLRFPLQFCSAWDVTPTNGIYFFIVWLFSTGSSLGPRPPALPNPFARWVLVYSSCVWFISRFFSSSHKHFLSEPNPLLI